MDHKCLSPWKGAVAGGLIVFAWSALSWMALPFHEKTLRFFSDPAPVVHALEATTKGSGIYLVHNDPKGQTAPTDPFVFVSYHKAGWGGMGGSMAAGLLIQMIGAFFWTWILGKIPGLTTKDTALYGAMFGVSVGVLGAMPYTVWWKFPAAFSLMYLADAVIGWTIASVVIGRWCQASTCAIPAAAAR